jgi:hypothetical protein
MLLEKVKHQYTTQKGDKSRLIETVPAWIVLKWNESRSTDYYAETKFTSLLQ